MPHALYIFGEGVFQQAYASVLIVTHHTREAIKLNDKIMFGIEWTYVFLYFIYSNCAFENVPVEATISRWEYSWFTHLDDRTICMVFFLCYSEFLFTMICVWCERLRTETFNLTKHNVRVRHGYEQWTIYNQYLFFLGGLFFSLSGDETWVRLLCVYLWKLMINFGACKWRRYKTST